MAHVPLYAALPTSVHISFASTVDMMGCCCTKAHLTWYTEAIKPFPWEQGQVANVPPSTLPSTPGVRTELQFTL